MAIPEKKNFRGFMALWSGQMISTLGTNIVQLTIILWITFMTNDPLMLGLAGFAALGSQLALTPIAGVYVDRWSRKKVIAVSDGLQALAALTLIYLFTIGEGTVLNVLIVIAARGGLGAFHDPAVQAIIPIMVPDRWLSRINGLTMLVTGMSFAVAGPIAGFVYLLFGGYLANILWIDVTTFLVAVVPTVLVFIPPIIMKKGRAKKRSFRRDFAEGLTFIRRTRGLLTLLSTFTIANFLLVPLLLLLPLYVYQVLAAGDIATGAYLYGTLNFFYNLSFLIGAGVMTVWKGFRRNVFGVVGGLALGSIGMMVFPFSTELGTLLMPITSQGAVYVAAFGLILAGLVVPVANVSSQTIWQKVVPPEKLGRVYSVRLTLAQMTAPFAMLFSGVMADFIGMRLLLYICGLAELLALSTSWLLTSLPNVEQSVLNKKQLPEEEMRKKH
jgi:DHA3 family macrolide efflux protein-like MFS transporter